MCVSVWLSVCARVCVCVSVHMCARGAGTPAFPPSPLLPFLRRSARAEWLEWREGRPRNGAVPPPSGAPAGRVGEGGRAGAAGGLWGGRAGRRARCLRPRRQSRGPCPRPRSRLLRRRSSRDQVLVEAAGGVRRVQRRLRRAGMQARPRARRPRPRLARVARPRGGPRRGDPPGCPLAVASPLRRRLRRRGRPIIGRPPVQVMRRRPASQVRRPPGSRSRVERRQVPAKDPLGRRPLRKRAGKLGGRAASAWTPRCCSSRRPEWPRRPRSADPSTIPPSSLERPGQRTSGRLS